MMRAVRIFAIIFLSCLVPTAGATDGCLEFSKYTSNSVLKRLVTLVGGSTISVQERRCIQEIRLLKSYTDADQHYRLNGETDDSFRSKLVDENSEMNVSGHLKTEQQVLSIGYEERGQNQRETLDSVKGFSLEGTLAR